MADDLYLLTATAFCVGVFHTLLGPDHYVPFVAISRSSGWSLEKTLLVTVLCGLGHVASSVVIGAVGLAIGAAVLQVETVEAIRGEVAAWLLLAFGIAYLTWGAFLALQRAPHVHRDDLAHAASQRLDSESGARDGTIARTWLLFLIFVFGPCEVLVPLFMYPAANANTGAVFSVVTAFALATIGTMVAAVTFAIYGLQWFQRSGSWGPPDMHRYSHAFTGAAVTACGMLVKFGL